MQLSISLLASIAAFFATANAVGICTGINSDGSCIAKTCRIQDIAVGQELEVPGTNCIFNTVNDPYVLFSSFALELGIILGQAMFLSLC